MDDIKLTKIKKNGKLSYIYIYIHTQLGYKDGNWHRKMWHANNEKRKMTNDGRNRTTKSRKNQNAWRKVILQVLGNIGSEHCQTGGDERTN